MLSLMKRFIKLEKELETCRKKARKSAKKVWYLKSKLQSVISTKSHASSELIDQIRYYENLSEELKEKVKEFETSFINVYEDGKYSNDIRKVYYELLSKNVSVNNCEDVIRTVLKRLTNKNCGRLPKKSLAAEMFVEMKIVSCQQVREAI